jgi:N-methylhydantoinase A/oxoprolinase/acetone carboxylase beta subunit
VAAADVQTTGLGGDSVVRPAGERRVQVGPERVIPLCMLAERYPAVLEDLERLSGGTEEGAFQRGEFLVLHRANADVALSRRERQIVDLLAERPLSRAALSRACGCAAPELLPVGRLEQTGIVRRSSVTPTDALHVLGTFTAFDVAAAGLGMRALGGALGVGEAEAARLVQEETERLLALALMRRELSLDGPLASRGHLGEVRSLLERALRGGEGAPFHLRWQQSRPVVGIGAPIAAFLPGACRRLDTRPLIPPHAEVANAVGAAVSKVAVRAELRIRPSQVGGYVLYAPDCRREFARLSRAIEGARRHVVELVRRRASRFGTHEREVHVAVEPRTGRLRDGSSQLVEVVVAGTLEGMPASG